MYTVKQTPEFTKWLSSIKDKITQLRLIARLRKVALGNLGDIRPVGDGVWEMREFFGGGWRMYYVKQDSVLVIMLGGGDKSTQKSDIQSAIELSKIIEGEKE
jgi:putative addiction module killer protein